MTNMIIRNEFNWVEELENTVLESLVKTFGLDSRLFDDKRGGDVDTIHKAREWQKQQGNNSNNKDDSIYMSQDFIESYKRRREYDPEKYHKSKSYIKNNKNISQEKKEGTLVDAYTGEQVSTNAKVDQDHVVSAKEIHDDAGRVLAEMGGVNLANSRSNLKGTNRSINRSKKDMTMEKFIASIPQKIENKQKELDKAKARLEKLESAPLKDQNKIDEEKKKIRNAEKYIEEHKKVQENPELAKKADKEARKNINKKINKKYYTSEKFFKATMNDMANKGLAMGVRQTFGLIFTEIWFEFRIQVPEIYRRNRTNFDLGNFLRDVQRTLKAIFQRVKDKFKDLLITFKDGFISGAMASLSTTLMNTVTITNKLVGKMIREMWNSLVGIIKVLFFNPNNLAMGDLIKEVMRLLGLGISTLAGSYVYAALKTTPIHSIPYIGDDITSFLSALSIGVLNLGFVYFLEHSEIMQKVWGYLNQFKPKTTIENMILYMQEVNQKLDVYLAELARVEFNFNVDELMAFNTQLAATNNELERNVILTQEIQRRGIELPYQVGNNRSVRDFLKGKMK